MDITITCRVAEVTPRSISSFDVSMADIDRGDLDSDEVLSCISDDRIEEYARNNLGMVDGDE